MYMTHYAGPARRPVNHGRRRTWFALLTPLALGACQQDAGPLDLLMPTTALEAKGGNGGGGNGGGGNGGSGGGFVEPSGRIYFASDMAVAGNSDIFVVNPDGSGFGRLTSTPAQDTYPRVALNADVVVFLREQLGTKSIFAMNTDGSNQRLVYAAPADGVIWEIAVSADGKQVAFSGGFDGQIDIWTVNIDGSGLKRITNDVAQETSLSFSPKGREIAYGALVGNASDIFTVTLSNGRINRLTSGAGANFNPAYSPDGRTIVFSSSRAGNLDLYTMQSDGTKQTKMYGYSGWGEFMPTFAPNGLDVVFLTQLNAGGRIHMNHTRVGSTNATGPVSSNADITAATWGR